MRRARFGWCLLFLGACASYKQNLMFVPPEGFTSGDIAAEASQAEHSFRIKPNDILLLEVYTNKGERIIDPEFELTRSRPEAVEEARPEVTYTVRPNGEVKLPLLGNLKISELTLSEAESMLQEKYSAYYNDSYVILRFDNKRVIVLGASEGAVVPLPYPGITLAEVLAISKSITNESNAENIRVLRGDKVFVIDMTKPSGFREYNLVMEPGDVVYVEPVRRPFSEGTRDISPLLSLAISLASLLVVILSLQ
jgi:polysaccharide export outer membrane protein